MMTRHLQPPIIPPTPDKEIFIVGLLVQVVPARTAQVSITLSQLPGAEIRVASNIGKLVLVCECDSDDETLKLIGRIGELPGVLNVALVYQHAESAQAMDEEICDEIDPPRIH